MILQKCHLGVTLCLVVFLLKPEIISCEAESKTISAEDLPVEHRGAKPEPFLDFVYDLFGGNKKTNKKNFLFWSFQNYFSFEKIFSFFFSLKCSYIEK